MACEVWFYHLERTGLDQALPELLNKTLARGWRALVRSPSQQRLEHLDGWLWSYRDEAFLPHGVVSEPMAERQPVLLAQGQDNLNQANVLFLLDDAEPGALDDFERCLIVIDGADEASVVAARKRWSAFKAQGLPLSYWQQRSEEHTSELQSPC